MNQEQRILLLLLLSIASCSEKSKDVDLQQGFRNDSTSKSNKVLFAAPQMVDSSAIVIYPLILGKTTSSSESYGYSGSSEKTSYWNLIFYNSTTATQHLLTTDKKILIYSIVMHGPYSSSSSNNSDSWYRGIDIFENTIIYTVVSKDFNSNKLLDENDPNYLFVSDKAGNNFRQVSPDDYHIDSWENVHGTTNIIMQGQKDENGDKIFDFKDKLIPLIVDVNIPQTAREIFTPNYIDTLTEKFFNIWKPMK